MQCIRLFKDTDGKSGFQEGSLTLQPDKNQSVRSERMQAVQRFLEETQATAQPTWHRVPNRQLVVTLTGTLEFKTAEGWQFTVHAGDVLLAGDTTGSGHGWRIVGDEPWRRVYIVLGEAAIVPFRASQ